MKRIALVTIMLSFLLLSTAGIVLVETARADPFPTHIYVPIICIKADGSIIPQTDLISRNGNTYTLTGNVNDYQIQIEHNDTVLEGDGHSISINHGSNPGIYVGSGANSVVTNVTIKNVEILNATFAIEIQFCSHCKVTDVKTDRTILLSASDYNNITENNMQIWVNFDSENNLITKNNITKLSLSACSNLFYLNNMLLDEPPSIYSSSYFPVYNNSWDNGSVGNYWSNYTTLYPEASEIGYNGLGNIPYIMEGTNIDYHPLMYPYDIGKDTIALPARTPSPPPTRDPEPEPFPTAIAAGASLILVATIVTVYLIARRRKIAT
jgi:hypothetical protein